MLVVPRPDQQDVADDDPAGARCPSSSRAPSCRAGSAARRAPSTSAGPSRKLPASRSSIAPNTLGRVHARQAQPLDVAARRDQRARLAVGQERVVGDRRERAAPVVVRERDAPSASAGAPPRPGRAAPSGCRPRAGPGSPARPGPARRRTRAPTASALPSPVTRNSTSRAGVDRVGSVSVTRGTSGAMPGRFDADGQRALQRRARRSPGKSDAVCTSGPEAEQHQVEPRRRVAELLAQRVLVGGRRPRRGPSSPSIRCTSAPPRRCRAGSSSARRAIP